MKGHIKNILSRYENEIIQNVLGSTYDIDGTPFVKVYSYEWKEAINEISKVVSDLYNYDEIINPIGLSYMFITVLHGIMTFDNGDVNMNELIEICKAIIKDIEKKIAGLLESCYLFYFYLAIHFVSGVKQCCHKLLPCIPVWINIVHSLFFYFSTFLVCLFFSSFLCSLGKATYAFLFLR